MELKIKKAEAKEQIKTLIEYYEGDFRHINANFMEEDTKQKLIQPLFNCLGWDFTKDHDVSYERSGGKNGRVDFVLGNRHFYIEAKSVNQNLEEYLLQANEYAYHKGRFCVLTDFQSFKLIKPIKPSKTKPQSAVVEIFDWNYKQYLDKFDLLWDTFSKEAVLLNGSLDVLLENEKKKRKFYTVDEDFLLDLDNWRKELAQDIFLNNKKVIGANGELLTGFSQRILDRIIFSKFLEDRGIEENILRDIVDSEHIYQKMTKAFKEIGKAYNGLIFNPHEVDGISVSDDALKVILNSLYDTPRNKANYKFDLIPIEILGSVYERFLGKVIEVNTTNQKVYVKDKPEVAKSKGIYYTPDAIVDYIIKNTVEKLFINKSFEKVSDIKIADISCGSGSFLVGVYSFLLVWYLSYYTKYPSKAGMTKSILNGKLTRQARKEILVRHIYGVDIDPQACEVAQMSLYLKMLDDCPDVQREIQLSDLILPDMKANIMCGNSLIGPEYFINDLLSDADRIKSLKAFDWNKHFKGGFDCVIGNPPYIDSETMTKEYPLLREAIQKSYSMTKGNWDIYIAFFERGLKLLKPHGFLSFITPDKWISKPFGEQLRTGTLNKICSIYNAGRTVFKRAKVDAIVTIFSNEPQSSIRIYAGADVALKRTVKKNILKPPYAYDGLFSNFADLLHKIESQPERLSDIGICENACATSDCYKLEKFIENHTGKIQQEQYLKIINTGTIGKYLSKWGIKEMVYQFNRYPHPVVQKDKFLNAFKNSYGQKSIKSKVIMKGLNLLDACLDVEGNIIPGKTTLMIPSNNSETLKILVALINSNLFFLYLKEKYPASSYNQGTTFTKDMINNMPIPVISESVGKTLVSLVDRIIAIKQQRNDADVSPFENEINQQVYKMYNLIDEEIEIVDKWITKS